MSAAAPDLAEPAAGASPVSGAEAPGPFASPSPVVVLEGVFARDTAGPRGSSRGALLGATASLGPGVHAFLGAPEDGTIALCDTLAGVRRPLRGVVRIAGEDPSTSPAARARTGALLSAPELPDARSVRACVEQVLAALGGAPSEAGAVLSDLGLGLLGPRSTAALSYAEARAVELALALAVVKRASPGVLVLFEPCADLAVPSAARAIEDVLAAQRAAGAVVVLATSSPADARRLADEVRVLHRGVVLRHEPAGRALAGGDAEVAVTVAAGEGAAIRALAAALAEHPAVRAALWEHPDPAAAGRHPVLRVRGPDRDACALAVIDAAAGAGVALESITSSVPDLPAVRSAAVAAIQRARAATRAPFTAGPRPVSPPVSGPASPVPPAATAEQASPQVAFPSDPGPAEPASPAATPEPVPPAPQPPAGEGGS